MIKTTKLKIRDFKSKEYEAIKDMSFMSARLYNVANYEDGQFYYKKKKEEEKSNKKIKKKNLSFNEIYYKAKHNENYIRLPTCVVIQTLRTYNQDRQNFFNTIKKGKITKFPKYKKKTGHFILKFPRKEITIKKGNIYLPIGKELKKEYPMKRVSINFPNHIDKDKVKYINIIPKHNAEYFEMDIVYEQEINLNNLNNNNYLSIDIGLNNLATCFDSSRNKTFILNGKQIKNINYFWNKEKSWLNSIKSKQKIKRETHREHRITQKRKNKIQDIMKKSACKIVNYCINNDIGNIIMGYNKRMSKEINLGKINNQNITQVPFYYFMNFLKAKANFENINFYTQEESYTSKCSCLDLEEIEKKDNYLGKRIRRGLFKSKKGYYINSDVNGAVNILRKYFKVNGIEFNMNSDRIKGISVYPERIRVS